MMVQQQETSSYGEDASIITTLSPTSPSSSSSSLQQLQLRKQNQHEKQLHQQEGEEQQCNDSPERITVGTRDHQLHTAVTASSGSGIQQLISDSLKIDSKERIDKLLLEISQMSDVEKLYLYLKLPSGQTNDAINSPAASSSCCKTTSKSLSNSLSNATTTSASPVVSSSITGKKAELEVSQTYCWIRTHLEEDSCYSLPKHEVYEDYKDFCNSSRMDPLCVADFGKAMKQMFPHVKPRRLGQRGNSKYCYSGLKKRFSIRTDVLPSITSSSINDSIDEILSGISVSEVQHYLAKSEKETEESQKSVGISGSQVGCMDGKFKFLMDTIIQWAESVTSLRFPSVRHFLNHMLRTTTDLSPSSGLVIKPLVDLMSGRNENENLSDASGFQDRTPCTEKQESDLPKPTAFCERKYKKIIPKISATSTVSTPETGSLWALVAAQDCETDARSVINKRRHSSAQGIPGEVMATNSSLLQPPPLEPEGGRESESGNTDSDLEMVRRFGRSEDLMDASGETDSSDVKSKQGRSATKSATRTTTSTTAFTMKRSSSGKRKLAFFQSHHQNEQQEPDPLLAQDRKLIFDVNSRTGTTPSTAGSLDSGISIASTCSSASGSTLPLQNALQQQQQFVSTSRTQDQQQNRVEDESCVERSDVMIRTRAYSSSAAPKRLTERDSIARTQEAGTGDQDVGRRDVAIESEIRRSSGDIVNGPNGRKLNDGRRRMRRRACVLEANSTLNQRHGITASSSSEQDEQIHTPHGQMAFDSCVLQPAMASSGSGITVSSTGSGVELPNELQLSQLRKLLEQNLPPIAIKKNPALLDGSSIDSQQTLDEQQSADGCLISPDFLEDGASVFTDPCPDLPAHHGVDTDLNNDGRLFSSMQTSQSDPNSLLHSPTFGPSSHHSRHASVPGSPAVVSTNGDHSPACLFQPIGSTLNLHQQHQSQAEMCGGIDPSIFSAIQMQQSTQTSAISLPASCTSSPFASPRSTPVVGLGMDCRSRNDSGHSTYSMTNNNGCNVTSIPGYHSISGSSFVDSGVSSIATSPFVSPQGTPIPSASVQQQLFHTNDNPFSMSGVSYVRNRSGSGFMTHRLQSLQQNRSNQCKYRTRHSSGPGHFLPQQQQQQQHQQNSVAAPVVAPYQHPRPISKSLSHITIGENGQQLQNHPLQSQQLRHPALTRHSVSMEPPRVDLNELNPNRSRHMSSPFCCNLTDQSTEQYPGDGNMVNSSSPAVSFNRSHSDSSYGQQHAPNLLKTGSAFWYQETGDDSSFGTSIDCPLTSGCASQLMAPTNRKRVRLMTGSVPSVAPSSIDQDLQMTLEDLRDCDNEFSRFALELEATFSTGADCGVDVVTCGESLE